MLKPTHTLAAMTLVLTSTHCVEPAEEVDAAEPLEAHADGCDCAEGARGDAPTEESLLSADDWSAIAAADAPSWGGSDAPVTLVLFADYDCPFCTRIHDSLRALAFEHGAALRIVFRQQPLPFHPHAIDAARAALAAAEQGAFDRYQARLYARPAERARGALERHAAELGLDVDAFVDAVGSAAVQERVRRDIAHAERLGVRGTPTLFINGRRLVGARPLAELRAAVRDALAQTR